MKKIIILFFILSIFLFACSRPQTAIQNNDVAPDDTSDFMMDGMIYQGQLLAGSESKYLVYNKQDYEKALKENKKVLLYFYANWCNICKAEQQHAMAAFDHLKDPNLVGFRINFKDSDTDNEEEALAREYGIAYQHTKVILVNGQRILKSPEAWDYNRYLNELNKI
ncbi:MAG TPA: thioredoxin family protein [Candidatus Nanoarchaeia archaeon]|nr:thioredoxin family protein [Candidatus Nanoarchaeia archaeon]